MDTIPPKSKRGGARPGAGRKPGKARLIPSASADIQTEPNGFKPPALAKTAANATEARFPAKAQQVIAMRAQGIGKRKVSRLTGLAPQTVLAIDARNRPALDQVKNDLAASAYRTATRGMMELETEVSDASPRDKAVIVGIATDKALALTNDLPTQRHDDTARIIAAQARALDTTAAALALLASAHAPDAATLAKPVHDADIAPTD